MFFILKELILFVAEVFYILKFYDKSSNLYCLVYKNGENELECLERMVSCYGHLEKIDLVLKYCNKYLEIDENNFNILYFKGQALFYKSEIRSFMPKEEYSTSSRRVMLRSEYSTSFE